MMYTAAYFRIVLDGAEGGDGWRCFCPCLFGFLLINLSTCSCYSKQALYTCSCLWITKAAKLKIICRYLGVF